MPSFLFLSLFYLSFSPFHRFSWLVSLLRSRLFFDFSLAVLEGKGTLTLTRTSICPSVRSFVRSFLRSFVHSFIRSFLSFVRSFLRSFVRSFRLFVRSFRSYVRSFRTWFHSECYASQDRRWYILDEEWCCTTENNTNTVVLCIFFPFDRSYIVP